MRSVVVLQICVFALLLCWTIVNADDCGVVRGNHAHGHKRVRTPLDLFKSSPAGQDLSSHAGGQYCSKREGLPCCPFRDDQCTAPISVPGQRIGHLCYCDNFCNRESTNKGNDCCPDYAQVCRGAGNYASFSSGNESVVESGDGRRIIRNEPKPTSSAYGDAQSYFLESISYCENL
ncbi:putative peptidase C1-like protein F26E4.3 [Ditylenchus destructor]|nr:putative peptidase C1-like protein F26E4.3 [Ditylenchus destructor]